MLKLVLVPLLLLFGSVYSVVISARDDNFPARVPYIFPAPGTDPIADKIRSRRPNNTLLALDGVLLNAPSIASGWDTMFSVIRSNNSLPGDMRELLILRVAVLNEAAYEWIQHEPVGRSAGLTQDQLLAIRFTPAFATTTNLTEPLLAAMHFADYLTKTVRVPQDVFDELAKHLTDQQMVEATATAGAYNFVSRFLVALDVDGKMDTAIPVPM